MLNDFLKLGFANLWRHRGRSLLTVLGIVIGVAAVVCMAGYGEGAKRAELRAIEDLGARNILLSSVQPPLAGQQADAQEEGQNPRNFRRVQAYGLTDADAERLRLPDNGPVDLAVPLQRAGTFVHRGSADVPQAEVFATQAELPRVARLPLERGRFLVADDETALANVAVLGSDLARRLFPMEDPLGGRFEVDGHVFTAVGVLRPDGAVAGESTRFMAFVPLASARARFGPLRYKPEDRIRLNGTRVEIDRLILRVGGNADPSAVARRLTRVVDFSHAARQDVEVKVPMDLIRQKEKTRRIFTLLMVLIAGLSLLVGGIGIMNIMLASVVERTREIGIRRAMGATRRQVAAQFLIETTALSGIGGVLGILLGLGACGAITWLSTHVDWLHPAVPEAAPILVSFVVSAGTGIVFGLWPAVKASRQDPIVALRHD